MPDAMRYSPWSGLPGRTILMPGIPQRLVLPTRAAGCMSAGTVLAGSRSPPRRPPHPAGLCGSPKDARQPGGRNPHCSRPSPRPRYGISCSLSLELDEASALSAWAYKALPRKNQLINTDALAVEAAFEARLRDLGEAAQS